MTKKPEISLIICTHQRAELLLRTLPHYTQLIPALAYELLIVLNACTDESLENINQIKKTYGLECRVVKEEKVGLSQARNRAIMEAGTDWLVYIDDDAYPQKDLLLRLKEIIEIKHLSAFSGRTLYWQDDRPKWIHPILVETPKYRQDAGLLPRGGFITGCICGFNKAELESLGGFPTEHGMKANEIAYGEEIHVQKKLEKNESIIWYDPNLIVYHRSHFSSMKEFISSHRSRGRSAQALMPNSAFYHIAMMLKQAVLWPFALIRNSQRYNLKTAWVLTNAKFSYHLGRLTA